MNKRLHPCMILFILLCSIAFAGEGLRQQREDKMEEELTGLKVKYHDSEIPFGVLEFLSWNHSWNNYKYPDELSLEKTAALMKEAGIGWVRMDFLWQDIEPKQSEFNFSKYDYIVNLFTYNGINLLGLLSYSTTWAGPAWNSPPYKNQTFIQYACRVIERYKDKVKYWEIWNEPDDELYWQPQDEMLRYTSLLQEVYVQAKRIDPACKILNGGLSKSITLSLKRIYKNGGGGYFDILAIHPFVNPLNDIDVARIGGLYKGCKKIMQENNDDKKIWLTELGSPGVRHPDNANSWWMGLSPTEEQQAEWVEKIYTKILPQLPDCEVIFWAFFRDCKSHWNNGIDYFGLLRWDYSRKPAFLSYKKCYENWKKSH